MENKESEDRKILEEFERSFEVLTIRDEAQIERELRRGPRYLRFSPIIEKAFLNYYLTKYIWQIRLAVLLGVIMYAAFGLLDFYVFPEKKEVMWTIRYAIVCPLGIAFFLLTYKIREEWLIHTLHTLLVVIAGLGIIVMIAVAPPEKAFLYYAGLMLVVFYAYTLSALRFYYALFASLMVTVLYPIVDHMLVGTSLDRLITNMFFLTSANLMGMPVSYLWEHHIRRDFLLAMLLALEKKKTDQLNRKLRDISYIDGLTGVANRLKFEEYFRREWDRAKRTKRPISLLMIDIDFFKNYNDLLGHLEGDACLRRIAQALSRHLRAGMDLVARYGGEEFVVVLPETDLTQAKKVADRIREDVLRLNIPHPASKVSDKVTVSIGVASMVPRDSLKKEVLINMADKALYAAKKGGRNRVEVFTFSEEPA